ncbi:MAG: DinB family protein [Candidatus Zixiibacteriota bacterium]
MAGAFTIDPIAGFPPRIGSYLAQMEDVRRRTLKYVEGLTPEQLSWYPQPNVESIGTLLLHIAAVECSWIGEDIMRRTMGDEWKIALPIRLGIPQVTGQPLAFFLNTLRAVREQTKADLASLTDDDLGRLVAPLDPGPSSSPDHRFTIEWILYHIIEHEAHHKGQIAVMKRLLPPWDNGTGLRQ